ncbi:hypothetical protein [Streptomyces sp. NPDC093089]|uniref:hypothetical protein n=1 Tax=Streptomyces sp. NPDC093089 TaxID=3366024 RepID=UPI003809242A
MPPQTQVIAPPPAPAPVPDPAPTPPQTQITAPPAAPVPVPVPVPVAAQTQVSAPVQTPPDPPIYQDVLSLWASHGRTLPGHRDQEWIRLASGPVWVDRTVRVSGILVRQGDAR